MLPIGSLDPSSQTPLYRQLYSEIKQLIESGGLPKGGRLPATRELAGQLGLNRATGSSPYELLEADGLIAGHVGRGSFVATAPAATENRISWTDVLEPSAPTSPGAPASTPLATFS